MNIQEYISTGILECYVLDQLSQEEKRQVETLALQYAEVRAEIESIEKSLESFAKTYAKQPPAFLKEKIFSKINESKIKQTARIIPIQESNKWPKFVVAASVSVAIISSTLSLYFWSQWKATEKRAFALEQESFRISKNYNEVKQLIVDQNNTLVVLSDYNTKQIELKGVEKSPKSRAIVYWNKYNSSVYINPVNLPKPSPHMQYQLWALVDGKPVDAGVFILDNDKLSPQKMKLIAAADAFAVTLEKEGGSATPTLEQMYLMGQI